MDIVERLRKPVDDIFFGEVVEPIKWEAANEIERLREKVNSLLTAICEAGDLLDAGELIDASNRLDEAKFNHNMEK